MSASPDVTTLVCSLTDSLMLLAPVGWTQVEVAVSVGPRGVSVASLNTRGDGAAEPRPRPALGLDERAEAKNLGEGLTELLSVLAQRGKRLSPAKVVVERAGEALDWKLVDAAGAVAWFTRLEKAVLQQLLVTDELYRALSGTERAFEALQSGLTAKVGEVSGARFDAPSSRLLLGETALPAQLVGRYDLPALTWVWGWAEAGVPPASTERVLRVCTPEIQTPGMSALWRPAFHCDEGFAWALAAHVAVSIGARGLVRVGEVHAPAAFVAVLSS